jgi:hypothetical protein
MNSACLIAACAATARRNNSNGHNRYAHYFDRDFDIYYRFKIRKYYHFEPMMLVKPTYEPCYMGSIYAPILQSEVQLTPVKVDAKTIAVEHSFTVYEKNCPNGVDNYIKDNLERLVTSGVWYDSDRQALDLYVTELNRKYNINLDKSSLRYTNQYCWEVEV